MYWVITKSSIETAKATIALARTAGCKSGTSTSRNDCGGEAPRSWSGLLEPGWDRGESSDRDHDDERQNERNLAHHLALSCPVR